MINKIKVKILNSPDKYVNYKLQMPTQCPVCSVNYYGTPLSSFYVDIEENYNTLPIVYCLYYCSHCSRMFLVIYSADDSSIAWPEGQIVRVYPSISTKTEFSKYINDLSPKFIEIYNQSEQAENKGLNEICGLGYRKALEFLVKDFAIQFNPDKDSSIKEITLANCIETYIDNKRIKTLAKASTWLGNDETHYVRKHEDYDIQHLKLFINSLVSFIDSEFSYLEAEKLIAKK